MSVARKCVVALVMAVVLLTSARVAQAQDSLNAARDLYAAAAYDEALTALNALAARHEAITESGTVALYRALCLYALGRNADGDRAVEALVAQNPLYRPPMDELAPRMRTTVADTRRRMLPGLLQQKYTEAKAAFDHQDYASALDGFTKVIDGLSDPDIAAAASQSPLADLSTLASGFRDLAAKALTPPPVQVAAAAAVVLPAPAAAASRPRVYSAADADVVPPVAVRQVIPTYTRPVTQRRTAIVELLVDENGAVESASMVSSLDPQFDKAVVTSAKNWHYEPARAGGQPVRYQKRVQITLVPNAAR